MASAEQIKLLAKAHYSNDYARFDTLLIQLAATEAQKGNANLARDLKNIIKKSKENDNKINYLDPETQELIEIRRSELKLKDLIVSKDISNIITQVINEYSNREKLRSYGLNYRSKLLLAGPPGTGKTLTASILANELNLPLCVIKTDKIVNKHLGETSLKLNTVFEFMSKFEAVYLFDEFDSIASERNFINDVGEIRRVINSLLQQIENHSYSFIIGATNNPQLLDSAIFRRFDDIVVYSLPDANQRKKLIRNTISLFENSDIDYIDLGRASKGLSHAEIVNACKDAIKEVILDDSKLLNTEIIRLKLVKKLSLNLWEK